MGKTKASLTRRRMGRRYVAPSVADSASDSSPSSMHLAPSSFPQPRLEVQSLRTKVPIESTHKRQKSRRKRQNSGDDVAVRRQEESDSSGEEQEEIEEEVVTIAVSELDRWQQRVIFHVEDHFSNEQLKRIAEFGRVHSSILQEAKDYVAKVEEQMRLQLESEQASLRAQADEFVEKTRKENKELRRQVKTLEDQVDGLQNQVESLEKKVDVLESDKAQRKQPLDDGKQRRNCDKKQQQLMSISECRLTGGEMRPSEESNLTNGGQKEIGLGSGGRALRTSDPPKTMNRTIDGTALTNPSESTPQLTDVGRGRQQVQHHQEPNNVTANGLSGNSLPSTSAVTSEGHIHTVDSCKAPTTAAG